MLKCKQGEFLKIYFKSIMGPRNEVKMYKNFISIISFTIFLTIFITAISGENLANLETKTTYYWPTPNFTGISSKFRL